MHAPGAPRSHPDDLMLLLYSVGALGPAFRSAVAEHAAGCARCGALLRDGEAVGGALLADEAVAPLAAGALDSVLARLDDPAPPSINLSDLLALRPWPVAPGVRHVRLLADRDESLHLFRVRPGGKLPDHDHGGDELTCVLEGAFEDATGVYEAGDAVPMRPGRPHEPRAIGQRDCVCLLAVSGHLRFSTPIARLVQRVLGL
jgi:putative transcriptional regulator